MKISPVETGKYNEKRTLPTSLLIYLDEMMSEWFQNAPSLVAITASPQLPVWYHRWRMYLCDAQRCHGSGKAEMRNHV